MLWNILHDEVFLILEYLDEVTLIGFADDIPQVSTKRNDLILMYKVHTGWLTT